MTRTDPATLPQFQGKPVPWVTRWSEEPANVPYGVEVIRGADGKPEPRITYGKGDDERDASGALWQKEGITKKGFPQWARVSTYRQRAAMRKRRCQVCGIRIPDGVIRWLMPIDGVEEYEHNGEHRSITMQPPTCDGCVDLSLELCPNLQKYGYQVLRVLEFKEWGVYGEMLVPPDVARTFAETGERVVPGPMGLFRIQTSVGFDEDYGPGFSAGMVLAKQVLVELTKFVVETVVPGRERPNNFGDPIQAAQEWLAANGMSVPEQT